MTISTRSGRAPSLTIRRAGYRGRYAQPARGDRGAARPSRPPDAQRAVTYGGTMDLLAELIRRTPGFRGQGRIVSYWLKTRSGQRTRVLPGGLHMSLNMSVPYEAMVWLGWEERA